MTDVITRGTALRQCITVIICNTAFHRRVFVISYYSRI